MFKKSLANPKLGSIAARTRSQTNQTILLQNPLDPPVQELQQTLDPPMEQLPEPVEPYLQQLQQLQLKKYPVVVLTRLQHLEQGFRVLKPPAVEIQELNASISQSPGPPELYIATLDPIRASPDLEIPVLEMEIVDTPIPIPETETLCTPVPMEISEAPVPIAVIETLDAPVPLLQMEILDTPIPIPETETLYSPVSMEISDAPVPIAVIETLDAPVPLLETKTLDAPVPLVEMKTLDTPALPVPDYEDMESVEEKTPFIEFPETPKVEIPDYECPLEEATLSQLENSIKQLSVSKISPIPIPMVKLEDIKDSPKSSPNSFDEIKEEVKEEENSSENEAENAGAHSDPFALQMNEADPEIDVGETDGNNNPADEPDPALVQLMFMCMNPNPGLSRHYAQASPQVKNAIRDEFNAAFNNMDKNPDVYDMEMLRLFQLYPLELIPEEIVEYYLGPNGH